MNDNFQVLRRQKGPDFGEIFRQSKWTVNRVAFHFRSALRQILFNERMSSFIQGWEVFLGFLVIKGAILSRMSEHVLLKPFKISLVFIEEQIWNSEEANSWQNMEAEVELKMRERIWLSGWFDITGKMVLNKIQLWSVTPISIQSMLFTVIPVYKTRSNMWP